MLTKPYKNIWRKGRAQKPFMLARDSGIAVNYKNSYEIIKNDLIKLFEYIEPHSNNFTTYSHRTFELLIRSCTEVESHCKTIFKENHISLKNTESNMIRYSDLEQALKLSEFCVESPITIINPIYPFKSFSNKIRGDRSPEWYKDYNKVKHDRLENFNFASLKNVIYAIAGISVLLVAQYGQGFEKTLRSGKVSGVEIAKMRELFIVKEVPEWPDDERYDFKWNDIKDDQDPYDFHPLKTVE